MKKISRAYIWYNERSKRIRILERRTGKQLEELIPNKEIKGKLKRDPDGNWLLSEPYVHELEEGEISDVS